MHGYARIKVLLAEMATTSLVHARFVNVPRPWPGHL